MTKNKYHYYLHTRTQWYKTGNKNNNIDIILTRYSIIIKILHKVFLMYRNKAYYIYWYFTLYLRIAHKTNFIHVNFINKLYTYIYISHIQFYLIGMKNVHILNFMLKKQF